jgi:hypothetical protein
MAKSRAGNVPVPTPSAFLTLSESSDPLTFLVARPANLGADSPARGQQAGVAEAKAEDPTGRVVQALEKQVGVLVEKPC